MKFWKYVKKIDVNFEDVSKDVDILDNIKKQLSKEDLDKVESYIRTQKLMSYLDEQISKLENESKEK